MALLSSCREEKQLSYGSIDSEYYATMAVEGLKTNSYNIRDEIARLVRNDRDSLLADRYTRAYYKRGGDFLWINRYGVNSQADTLVAFLDSIELDGFSTSKIHLAEIRENMERIRKLAFADEDVNQLNQSLAATEYYLTKALLRCGVGVRYGITNPYDEFNNIDIKDSDSVHVTYRQLFDIPMATTGRGKFEMAIEKVRNDSVGTFLRAAQQHSPLYRRLKDLLKTATGRERERILVNMERARWQTKDAPHLHEEYIIVNIPAYHLWAVNKDSIMDMRIGCGSRKTKTPLLYSNIERMDINPQWIIPGTIVTKEILHHAGNGEYFTSRRYFAQHRRTGRKLYGDDITYEVLASKDYYIAQEGGEGNALGRIIFRFPNNFAVYLHDTSSRGVFAQNDRSVSHGCVRVERPYDLACFLLRGKDDELTEKIRYCMTTDLKADDFKRSMLINSAKVEPRMPLFITYFTVFPTPSGRIETYPDVYGYDALLKKSVTQ